MHYKMETADKPEEQKGEITVCKEKAPKRAREQKPESKWTWEAEGEKRTGGTVYKRFYRS